MKNEIPLNIWARDIKKGYLNKDSKRIGQWIDHNKPHFNLTQYTNTQQAIDKLEGLKLDKQGRICNQIFINQAISILKGADHEN